MAKTTYTATDAAGGKHTRKTERSYSHTVVALPSYASDLDKAKVRTYDLKEAHMRFTVLERGEEAHVADGLRRHAILGAEYFRKQFAEYAAFVAQYGTPEAYADERVANRVAKIEERKAQGYYERWQNAGWNGRLDLAHKLAAQYQDGRWADVKILEAKEA